MTSPTPSHTTLGPRIAIIGPSNSGKSTLAVALGQKLNVPVDHLDQYAHHHGTTWVRRPDTDFMADHTRLIAKDTWIIDGNYSVCMPERFARATTIIWLDVPPWRAILRYVWCHITGSAAKRPGQLPGGNPKLSWNLIRFTLIQYPKNRIKYAALLHDIPSQKRIQIRSMKGLKRLYGAWGLSP